MRSCIKTLLVNPPCEIRTGSLFLTSNPVRSEPTTCHAEAGGNARALENVKETSIVQTYGGISFSNVATRVQDDLINCERASIKSLLYRRLALETHAVFAPYELWELSEPVEETNLADCQLWKVSPHLRDLESFLIACLGETRYVDLQLVTGPVVDIHANPSSWNIAYGGATVLDFKISAREEALLTETQQHFPVRNTAYNESTLREQQKIRELYREQLAF